MSKKLFTGSGAGQVDEEDPIGVSLAVERLQPPKCGLCTERYQRLATHSVELTFWIKHGSLGSTHTVLVCDRHLNYLVKLQGRNSP